MSKPRANKNIIKRLLSFALATVLSISSLSVISTPLEVHAGLASGGSGNGTGGGTGGAGGDDRGGASASLWGYRTYIVDETGTILSPIIDIVSQTPNANKLYKSTRFGEQSSGTKEPMPGLPAPFKFQGKKFLGNGEALRNWLLPRDGAKRGHIDDFITTYFGEPMYQLFQDTTTKKWLALEPITWHNLYRGADDLSQTSKRIYGTANNWLQAYSENKIGGSTYTSSLDLSVLQTCLMLERDQPELGLVKPSGSVPVFNNGNEGWGIHLYTNDGLGGYHTWDSKNYTGATYKPAKSPDPNEAKEYMGIYTVIKNYRSIGEDGVTLKDDDTEFYIRKLVNGKIKVEDEELYRVIGWKTSNVTASSKLDSTKWETTVPGLIVQEGTKRGDVELDKNKGETTLYVLLQREDVGTHTWDDEEHPDDPGPAPDDSDKYPPHEPDDKNYKCTIIKSYYTEDLMTGEKTDDGTYIRDDTSSSIRVETEKNWELVAYKGTDKEDRGISSLDWDPPGTVGNEGTSPKSITLDVENGEKYLYVLLRRIKGEPAEVPEEYDYVITESQLSRSISLRTTDKGENILYGFKFNWEAPTINPGTITHNFYNRTPNMVHTQCNHLDSSGNRLHPGGHDVQQGWNYHSTSQSHPYDKFYYTDRQWTLRVQNTRWGDFREGTIAGFGEELVLDGKKFESEDASHVFYRYQQGQYKKGNEGDPGEQQWISGGQVDAVNLEEVRDYDYWMTIKRGNDRVTFPEWKGVSGEITAESNFAIANEPQGRYRLPSKGTGANAMFYVDTIGVKFDKGSSGAIGSDGFDEETGAHFFFQGHSHNYSSSGGSMSFPNEETDAAGGINIVGGSGSDKDPVGGTDLNIRVYTFYGDPTDTEEPTPESGHIAVTDKSVNTATKINFQYKPNFVSVDGDKVSTGRMVELTSFSFYPYVQMRWDMNKDTKNLPIYVLGEFPRTIYCNSGAEVLWGKKDEANLNITSKQWSTHASTNNGIRSFGGLKKALPGGAVLYADTKEKDQTVYAITYQPILIDEGLEQVEATGATSNRLTEGFAESEHEKYVDSFTQGLGTVSLQQMMSADPEADWDVDDFGDWEKVGPGSDIDFLDNGSSKANKDSKYYFRTDKTQDDSDKANEGDVDIEVVNTTSEKYTFSTNVFGELLMNGSVVSTSDPMVKLIDERTKIVTHLLASLQYGAGKDEGWIAEGEKPEDRHVEAPDWGTAWYNEAFDGITVYVQATELSVGLKMPDTRQQVLDPKLIPETTSKANGRADYSKFYACAFRTNAYSDYYGDDQVAIFLGKDVHMGQLDKLFWSKQFFIPSMTTQDLR